VFTISFNFLDNVGFHIESIAVNNVQNESIVQSEETVFTNMEPVEPQSTYGYGNSSSNYCDPTLIVRPSTSNPDIQVILKKKLKTITNL